MTVKKIAYSVLAVGLVGSFVALDAQGPATGTTQDKNNTVVAYVNNFPITRQQLADWSNVMCRTNSAPGILIFGNSRWTAAAAQPA